MRNHIGFILVILQLLSCSGLEISEDEKQLLLSEKAFTDYGFTFPDAPQGKYSKYQLPDGAIEIRYSYKGYALDSSYFYLSNTITTDRNAGDAEETYVTKEESINLSTVINSKLIPLEGFHFGEESVLYLWLTDNEPVGNYFQFRYKNITYQLLLQGFYFSDPEDWTQFFNKSIAPFVNTILQQE